MAYQNDFEAIQDRLQQGLITPDQANVLLIQCAGVKLITSRIPMAVRRALNAAVKSGELGHMKKEGRKPEVYYHKNAKGRAHEARATHERSVLESLMAVCASATI